MGNLGILSASKQRSPGICRILRSSPCLGVSGFELLHASFPSIFHVLGLSGVEIEHVEKLKKAVAVSDWNPSDLLQD